MKACSIGLHNLVKKTLDNKPYFSYKENDNFGTITILDSYTKKINIKDQYYYSIIMEINKKIK